MPRQSPPCALPPGHPTGLPANYEAGCRCEDSKAARNAARRRRYRETGYGRRKPRTHTDSTLVRERITHYRDMGWAWPQIATHVGVARKTLHIIVEDTRGTGTCHTDTAIKILSAPAPDAPSLPAMINHVTAIGCARRLQALATQGWGIMALVKESERTKATTLQRRTIELTRRGVYRHIKIGTAEKIMALYERLWDQAPPSSTPGEKSAVSNATRNAQEHGWAPPMAWDEGAMDDPSAKPHRSGIRRREVEVMTGSVEDLAELVEVHGLEWPEAAARAGYRSVDSAQTAFNRYRRGRANARRAQARQDLAA